jgi:hypothetical protein
VNCSKRVCSGQCIRTLAHGLLVENRLELQRFFIFNPSVGLSTVWFSRDLCVSDQQLHVMGPSENRHEAARGASRLIETRHAPRSPSKSVVSLDWKSRQMKVHRGASRYIVITYINRILCNLWAGLVSSSFRSLIKNKLYSGTGY